MSEVNIKPLADRVVVRPLTDEEAGNVSVSGIIIPETAKQDMPGQGIVVAVGDGKWNEAGASRLPVDVKVGDKVLFSKYSYDDVKVDGIEYYVLAEANVLAIIG